MSTQADFELAFTGGFFHGGVEKDDLDSMESGWLTDSCIRYVIYRQSQLMPPSRIRLVDPTWFNTWEQLECHSPETTPEFIIPLPGEQLAGLAIPFNEGNNHWTTIYVNLEACGAIYYNTMRNAYRTERAKKLMEKFYDIFKEFFGTSRRFIFQEAQDCPQQLDGSSCGIYVACNVADLLAGAKPRTTRLTEDEIRGFRRKGLKLLKAAQPVQFQEYNS